MPLDVGIAERALPGEARSGDRGFVHQEGDEVLLAVLDGLGHGDAASEAADRAMEALGRGTADALADLVHRVHEGVEGTRGVVLTVARLDLMRSQVEWVGVGNVEARVFRSDGTESSALSLGGVVGYRLPALRPRSVPFAPGDLLVMATDGVAPDFAATAAADEPAEPLAGRLLARHAREEDDALVLVARLGA